MNFGDEECDVLIAIQVKNPPMVVRLTSHSKTLVEERETFMKARREKLD